jgi:hypothetical protein
LSALSATVRSSARSEAVASVANRLRSVNYL